MTEREALKLALDALQTCIIDGDGWSGPNYSFDGVKVDKAITAIREALAQPEQEPVAWKETDEVECPVCKDKGFPWPKCGHITYLEPTPPQRTWVGLSDEEISELIRATHNTGSFVRAIEAKLKEKNYG